MGNNCQSNPKNQPEESQIQEPINWHQSMLSGEVFQEFDNPKRQILDSNFLKGQQCSSNDISNKQIIGHFQSSNRIPLYKLESLSGEMDTMMSSSLQDGIMESTKIDRTRKHNTVNFQQKFSELKNKTIFRSAKQFILSERFIYEPMQIHPGKFVQVKNKNIESFYKFGQKIGEGSYGSVYKAMCKRTNQYRAIKILKRKKNKKKNQSEKQKSKQQLKQSKQPKQLKQLKQQKQQQQQCRIQQLQVLRILDHPNIIKLFEVYYWNESYYLVTQFCEGGSILSSFINTKLQYTESIVKRILKQILKALKYLHSLKIAHRDLKLQNIVFTKKINSSSSISDIHVKIIDFGESFHLKLPHNNRDKKQVGTVTYMAPQVLEGLYSEKCDIWSCGVIACLLLTGKSPFKRFSKSQTMKCIKGMDISFAKEEWQGIPQNLKFLIKQMLERDPINRPTASKVLQNSWFKQTQQKISTEKMKTILDKLYSYYRGNNLISVIQSYVTFLKITQQQRLQIAQLFNKMDTDNSGTIEINQLKEAFITCIGEQKHEQQVEYILRKLDRNGSRKIDLNEFITAIYGPQNIFHQNSLQLAFQYFDTDNNGYIDKKQLKKALKGCSQRDIKFILKDIDENQDGKISKSEFMNYIKNQKFL